MTITVLNKRQALSAPLPKTVRVVVDRTSGLGNPFHVTYGQTRLDAIAKYEVWLREQLKSKNRASVLFSKLLKLAEHNDIELVCWCVPEDCHANVIKSLLEEELTKKYHRLKNRCSTP